MKCVIWFGCKTDDKLGRIKSFAKCYDDDGFWAGGSNVRSWRLGDRLPALDEFLSTVIDGASRVFDTAKPASAVVTDTSIDHSEYDVKWARVFTYDRDTDQGAVWNACHAVDGELYAAIIDKGRQMDAERATK